MHLGLKTGLCAPYSVLGYRNRVPLAKFQMATIPTTLMSSGSKKKEPRYVYLSKAKASHSHRMWTEVSSSLPHFLQMGLLSPIICRCLLKVLCPVSRPVTTLDCVLLTHWHTQPAVRRSEPSMSFAFNSSLLSVDGMTCLLLFES